MHISTHSPLWNTCFDHVILLPLNSTNLLPLTHVHQSPEILTALILHPHSLLTVSLSSVLSLLPINLLLTVTIMHCLSLLALGCSISASLIPYWAPAASSESSATFPQAFFHSMLSFQSLSLSLCCKAGKTLEPDSFENSVLLLFSSIH